MTTTLFDFEGAWEVVNGGGSGILPLGWFPYGDPARTCEYGFPNEHDVHHEHLVKTGLKSLGYDKVWDTHDGGAGYFVNCTPGQMIEFLIFGRYIYHTGSGGSVAPIHMRIGIDPTGADVPGQHTIWSPEQEIAVKGWDEPIIWHPFEISARVLASIATLFLYTNPTERGYRGNGPVWDDGVCNITDDGCWGKPREQYKRIYNVVSSVAEAHRVIDIVASEYETAPGAKDGLQTVGPSSDDAGMGMLEDNTPIEWNRPRALHEAFREFYADHYPRAKMRFRDFTSWEQYLLWQGDPRWGDVTFGPGNCTMKNSACYITDLAMAQRIYGIDADATPLTVNDALGADGYAPDCNAKWSAVKNDLGLTISTSTKAQADAHINDGGVMLIEVLPKDLQHFVLAVEVLGDENYLVLDPWKNVVAPLLNLYPGWESWRMLTKTGTPEPPPPPGPGPGPQLPKRDSLIGGHFQTGMEGDLAWIATVGSGIFKFFSFEGAAQAKAVNPNIVSVVRMFTREQHIGGDPAQAAANEIARYHDALVKHHTTTDYIESWNEMYSSSDREANRWMVEFDKHFAYQIAELPVETRACTVVAAIGNPPEDWVSDLIPAVRAVYETDGCLGYHPYWWCNPAADGLHEMRSWWPWHGGRWEEWDKVITAHDLYPKYALGEAGVVGSGDGYALNAHAGWKSSHTLKSDWGRYFAQIAQFETFLKDWNATHGNRCLGATLFTTGADFTNWLNFQIRKDEMEALESL